MMFGSLFIFSFRSFGIMRIRLRIIVQIMLGLVVFIATCKALNYIYVPYSPWERILFHSYYDQDNIDNIYMGSSHVYCGVDPNLLDGINGLNNFNMSTPGQRWDDTYFLLRDALDRYDIKNVYLECCYSTTTTCETWTDKDQCYQIVDWIKAPRNYAFPWLITYEMKLSGDKIAMLYNAADADHMLETIFPFVRHRGNVFNWDQINTNVKEKNSADYKNYVYHQDATEIDGTAASIDYKEKGFSSLKNLRLLDQKKLFEADRDLSENSIGPESSKYLSKTISMCQRKGINVKLFICPIYDLQLVSTNDYDNYISEINRIAENHEVELYDFNLIKDEYLDFNKGDYYSDPGHLNSLGAEKLAPVLWDVLTSSADDNSKRFVKTYKEKLALEPPEIYGLYCKDINPMNDSSQGGKPTYTARRFTVASNRENMMYRITRTIEDNDEFPDSYVELIQDYSKNKSFDIPDDQHGKITIESSYAGENLRISIDY